MRLCDGKVRYSRSNAIRAKSYMEQRQAGERFEAYPCLKCGGHHIGHERGFHYDKISKNRQALRMIDRAKKEGRLR